MPLPQRQQPQHASAAVSSQVDAAAAAQDSGVYCNNPWRIIPYSADMVVSPWIIAHDCLFFFPSFGHLRLPITHLLHGYPAKLLRLGSSVSWHIGIQVGVLVGILVGNNINNLYSARMGYNSV